LLGSLGNNFSLTAVLHSHQNVFSQEVISFVSKSNASRFQKLYESFDAFIPHNITISNLCLTVYGLFELPESSGIGKEFFARNNTLHNHSVNKNSYVSTWQNFA